MGSLNAYDAANNQLLPIISPMVGATGSTVGIGGLVPTPQAGDENKALRGDGTWGSVDGGREISYADFQQLTPTEQNEGDWYIPDYNGSIIPIGGFDTTPTPGSPKPVTSNGIYQVTGSKNNLATTDKTSLVGAINEVKGDTEECKALKAVIHNLSSVAASYLSDDIEDDMEVVGVVLSNPNAQTGEWTWTVPDGGGRVTVNTDSKINGSTDVTMYLMKVR